MISKQQRNSGYFPSLFDAYLVVGDDGMPICSQIYKGNQSEPETMETMMLRLHQRLHGSQIPMIKPTVAMDKGFATADNVKWLQENGYDYIVIRREDGSEEYRRQFENERDTFELVSSGKSIYGDVNNVYVRKEPADGGICRVLCISEGKSRKEKEIYEKKGNPFMEDIEGLRKSIQKGSIKNPKKISDKLQRIIVKHGKLSKNYDASLETIEGRITGVAVVEKVSKPEPLFGCYVIESSHAHMSAEETWKLYMTLTRIESAFRSMKETLGVRPVYHQTAERSAAHIFLAVLAYHLLATIENIMAQQGDTRTWGTLREVMSTLMRGTVTMRDDQGATYHLRISGEPEDEHQVILDKLSINSLPETIVSKIDTL